jgi:hypothetical protein
VQERQVDGRHEEEVLVGAGAIGVRDPNRHAEEVGQRTRQPQRTREPHDRRVLRRGTQQLRGRRGVRRAVDDQPRAVDGAVGVDRLAAARGGEPRERAAQREARGVDGHLGGAAQALAGVLSEVAHRARLPVPAGPKRGVGRPPA